MIPLRSLTGMSPVVLQTEAFQCGRIPRSMIHEDDWSSNAVLERLPDEEYRFELSPSSSRVQCEHLVSLHYDMPLNPVRMWGYFHQSFDTTA